MTQEALGSAREKEHQLWEHYGRSDYDEWLGGDRTTAYDLRRSLPAKLALTGGARALFWQAQRPIIGPSDGLLIEYANDSVEVYAARLRGPERSLRGPARISRKVREPRARARCTEDGCVRSLEGYAGLQGGDLDASHSRKFVPALRCADGSRHVAWARLGGTLPLRRHAPGRSHRAPSERRARGQPGAGRTQRSP